MRNEDVLEGIGSTKNIIVNNQKKRDEISSE